MKLTTPMLLAGGLLAYLFFTKQSSMNGASSAGSGDSWGSASQYTAPTTNSYATPASPSVHKQISNYIANLSGGKEGSLGYAVMHGQHIEGDTIFKGNLVKSQAAHEYNLLRTYSGARILPTDNPLESKVVQTWKVGGASSGGVSTTTNITTSHLVFRSPTSQAESNAARAANLKSMIASGAKDPRTLNASSRALLGM